MNLLSLGYLFVIFMVSVQKCLAVPENITNIIKYEPKIVGGEKATFNGTKHLVSIRLKRRELQYGFGQGHICGGAVYNSTTILTAAHCILDFGDQTAPPTMRTADEFTLVMGTLNRRRKTNNTFQSNVVKIITHSKFSAKTMENDIALMILEKEIPGNNSVIKPISLVQKKLPSGTKCRVDGWGAIGSDKPGSIDLLTVNISLIQKSQCKQSYQNMLKDGMICAGEWNGGKDSCQGDSGGPLSCNDELVGIVSWGIECARPQLPGIYTDVYMFRYWIENHANQMANGNIFFILLSLVFSILFNY